MTNKIDVDTLRDWLDAQHAVTVVDVRTDEDRSQWAIPGSVHINAYDALRRGQLGQLADVELPRDRPVVTVCAAGRTSETAAEILARHGFDTWSLAGGMKAWASLLFIRSAVRDTSAETSLCCRRTPANQSRSIDGRLRRSWMKSRDGWMNGSHRSRTSSNG